MPSSTSSSDAPPERGQAPYAHHGPLAPGLRLTASDRPGIAQPVPERDVPQLPWAKMAVIVLLLVAALTAVWEWKMRSLGYEVGDLGDDPSAWVEQRRRLDTGAEKIAIVGDSRILFDTDLDRFRQLTGVRPVQLAISGSNALPVLEDVADHSPFAGLVIVGIADQSYFREGFGFAKDMLKREKFESPGQRSAFLLSRLLRRHSAMLDDDASLTTWIARMDPDWRKGVRGPYDDVWKLQVIHDVRETFLWPEVSRDAYVRAHATGVWMAIFGFLKPTAEVMARNDARTKFAVAKIRARGGDVVFVRPPSAEPLRALEEKQSPRAKGWDVLLRFASVRGVHFEDMPDAQNLVVPEMSHTDRACAAVFTDAYVRALSRLTPRLPLRPGARSPLHPGDCAPASPPSP